jgi:hypothetical protein
MLTFSKKVSKNTHGSGLHLWSERAEAMNPARPELHPRKKARGVDLL